jgi:putative FmdB family regulatory protein
MPIYEFECEEHGKFEALFPRVVGVEYQSCPTCDVPAPRIYSLTVMRPDTMWAGVNHRNYGYVTSASQLKAEMKRRNHVPVGDRTDREAWDKIADKAQDAKKEKLAKDVHEWNVKTFGPSGLGLGGADGEKFIRDNS